MSGGPDSVSLALLLRAIRRGRSLRIAAAHVNHGLRPSAAADERWVRKFCEREGIDFFPLRVDVKRRAAAEGESVEEAARRARYEALIRLARRKKFDCLATGHTADDQAETVLMRLASGSGLWGLASIPSERMQDGVRIIRPLLGISKRDILAALKRAGSGYRTDRSNASRKFVRNRVRGTVLPALIRELNPRTAEHLADLAADAGEWRAWAGVQAERFLKRSVRFSRGKAQVEAGKLAALPPPIRVPVYFRIAEALTRREQHLRREHIRQLDALLAGGGPGEARLANGLRVRRPVLAGRPTLIWSVQAR